MDLPGLTSGHTPAPERPGSKLLRPAKPSLRLVFPVPPGGGSGEEPLEASSRAGSPPARRPCLEDSALIGTLSGAFPREEAACGAPGAVHRDRGQGTGTARDPAEPWLSSCMKCR